MNNIEDQPRVGQVELGSDRSSAAPAACSMVPIALLQTSVW